MSSTSLSPEGADIQIAYDGDCPFCSAYVRLLRLRDAVGSIELLNAREEHPFVQEIRAAGLDLNEGMVAKFEGRIYHGQDCVHLLSMLSSPSGKLNRLIATILRSKWRCRWLYPVLRFGRNSTLRLMGRSRIV
ncbi:hypothetical protein MnTg02_02730 [bacterium MnTg02]|nr:hypothetical protein MnTg02_02730 [bacterium MnTg02]